MPGPRPPLAPHVQAALGRDTARGAGHAAGPLAPAAAQPRAVSPLRPLAPHVQTAVGRTAPPLAAQPKTATSPGTPGPTSSGPTPAPSATGGRDAFGFITYTDQKTPTSPPPPPRWPVYSLHCGEGGCRLQDVRTGRWREPGSMYAGFVRMGSGGTVYVSPRPDPKVPGDSHPTIASGTPEGQAGRKALVAAGEVGIVDNRIVGHNDKTGHYKTRKNYWQSGMPSDLYHPFTEDPLNWYKTKERMVGRREPAEPTP
jgi:hypothetical protein